MKKQGKTKVVIFAITGVVIVLAGCFLVQKAVEINEQKKADEKARHIIEIRLIDPDSVSISDKSKDITEEFFERHEEDIKKGEYGPALAEIRGNKYSLSCRITPENAHFFDENGMLK